MKSRDLLFALFSIIISSPGSKAQDSYLDLLFSTCWGLKRENSIENYEPQIDQDVEDDAKIWKWENMFASNWLSESYQSCQNEIVFKVQP